MEILKRVVIKEEFVAITGDFTEAIILNQFLYWSERVKDFDKFIEEENARQKKYATFSTDSEYKEQSLTYGWIYKKATELEDETMRMASERTINRKIDSLVEKGFLDRRNNPKLRYDRTYQYRINFTNLMDALFQKGYTLQGYKIDMTEYFKPLGNGNRQNDVLTTQREDNELTLTKNMGHKESFDNCNRQIDAIKSHDVGAIPEITTENNNKYILSQSVNNNISSVNEKPAIKSSEEKIIKDAINIIKYMQYPCPVEEMVINSLTDLIKTNGIKYLDRLTDKKIIDFAVNKFKKLDKIKIKNYQAYFTSILNNSVFEYAASEVVGQELSTNAAKKPKNKFHNFTQKMIKYSEEELEDIAKKKFNAKIKELKTCKR